MVSEGYKNRVTAVTEKKNEWLLNPKIANSSNREKNEWLSKGKKTNGCQWE